jgi:hypothetical protein
MKMHALADLPTRILLDPPGWPAGSTWHGHYDVLANGVSSGGVMASQWRIQWGCHGCHDTPSKNRNTLLVNKIYINYVYIQA